MKKPKIQCLLVRLLMTNKNTAQHLFNKWAAELRMKDRHWNNVQNNFEELFFELYKHEIPFEEANELVKLAVAKHLPDLGTAKRTFERVKKSEHYSGDTFQEWLNGWKKGIEDQGMQAFYAIYTPPALAEKAQEEKKFGSMSQMEYRKQRRYSESFPTLNTEELEKRLEAGINNFEDFFADLDNILEKKKDNE